jgi:hypothetical protein
MSTPPLRYRFLAILAVALLPAMASAQQQTNPPAGTQSTDPQYSSRRKELLDELRSTQDQLNQAKNERLTLQARIENFVAQTMQARAQQLLMSNEQTALQQIDAMVTGAQNNMLAQRDRMRSLGEAVRRRTGAVLVVVMRADSSQQTQSIATIELTVDNGAPVSRSYSGTANAALERGAVDELYRAEVLPTSHTVKVTVTVDGQPQTQTMNVNATGEAVTYVQFAVRNKQVTSSSWTSQGTTPF